MTQTRTAGSLVARGLRRLRRLLRVRQREYHLPRQQLHVRHLQHESVDPFENAQEWPEQRRRPEWNSKNREQIVVLGAHDAEVLARALEIPVRQNVVDFPRGSQMRRPAAIQIDDRIVSE